MKDSPRLSVSNDDKLKETISVVVAHPLTTPISIIIPQVDFITVGFLRDSVT